MGANNLWGIAGCDEKFLPLLKKAFSDLDEEVRQNILGSMARTKFAEKFLPEIKGLLKDSNAHTRRLAVSYLAKICGKEAVNDLKKALSDPDADVVCEAIENLEKIGDKSVIPDIENFLKNPDVKIRDTAETALRHLKAG